MSVDLERLREAREEGLAEPAWLVDAVLDAPTYYWCYVKGYRVSNTTDALHGRLNPTGDHSCCGWVALVPVVKP